MNDQAPLTLTLEEALVLLSGEQCYLRPSVLGRSWTILPTGHTEWIIERDTWPEAVSAALGRPVTVRDEAAELKAAARRLLAAVDELRRQQTVDSEHGTGQSGLGLLETTKAAWAVNDSIARLRRLAGGETE